MATKTVKIGKENLVFAEKETAFQTIGFTVNNMGINGSVGMTLEEVIDKVKTVGVVANRKGRSLVFADQVGGGFTEADAQTLIKAGVLTKRETIALEVVDLNELL